MKTIPSFTIDHLNLLRGIYVSRKDSVGGDVVTTFDVRMKEPNREPALGQGALHTIEHLAATYLRNNEKWADKIIYWGPMGCLTGNYLLMKGDLESKDIVELMKDTFRFISEFEGDIPNCWAKRSSRKSCFASSSSSRVATCIRHRLTSWPNCSSLIRAALLMMFTCTKISKVTTIDMIKIKT